MCIYNGVSQRNKKNGYLDIPPISSYAGHVMFFMLNSSEHEIFSANKYGNANNSWHFHIY